MMLRDPTVIFTALVVQAPLLLHSIEHGLENFLTHAARYLLSPTMIASYLMLYLVVAVANSGQKAKLKEREKLKAYWFLMNGVYFNLFLDVVSGQFQLNDLMTKQYNIVEPRYKFGPYDVRGQSVFWTSMCELFFQSPFCLLTYYAYVKGRPWRRPLEIIVSCLHICGVWWFYVPEAYAGFPHLGGWPTGAEHFSFHRIFYFYFGFWILGGLWVFVAFQIAKTAFFEISALVEIAEKTKSDKRE